MYAKTLFAAAAVITLGLSAIGTTTQTRAARETTAIETVVSTDFNTTWDILVAELSAGDFAVNATIKENSTIRVLLQSKTPSTWVDCGSISVNSKSKVFGDRSYDFLAANSVRYLVADEEVDELVDVERRTTLNALVTIKLTPMQQGTLVNVEAHYVMKFRTREFGRKVIPRSLDESLDFNSAGQASVQEEIREGSKMKVVTIDCRPTGELERRIVSVLERPHVLTAENVNRRPPDEQRASVTARQKIPSQTDVAALRLPEQQQARVTAPPTMPSQAVVTAGCPTGYVKDLDRSNCVPKLGALEKPAADKTVQRAQKHLAELGYKPGPADGIYGPKTRQAVQHYQESIGVPATGQVDEILLAQSEKSIEAVKSPLSNLQKERPQSPAQQPANSARQPGGTVSPQDVIAFLSEPLPAFHGLTVSVLILGFIIVWAIGLGPPVLIRYVLLKRPVGTRCAISICAGFWIANFVMVFALGSRNIILAASYLCLIAFVSYLILRRGARNRVNGAAGHAGRTGGPAAAKGLTTVPAESGS